MIHHRRMSLSLLALSALSLPAFANDTPATVFTSAQAKAGKAAYQSTCGICHLNTLLGRVGDANELPDPATLPENYQKTIDGNFGYVPPLIGKEFMAKWSPKTAGEFALRIQNATFGFPPRGSDTTTFLAVAAYILRSNGSLPGKQELTATSTVPVSATLMKDKPRKS